MEEEKHLARDETNENMEKDKIIDNGNIISWYNCHCNCSGKFIEIIGNHCNMTGIELLLLISLSALLSKHFKSPGSISVKFQWKNIKSTVFKSP
jgi:hypothetical protein